MKFYATSFCKTKKIDGWVEALVLKTLESVGKWQRVPLSSAELVVFVFTWTREFQFDENEFSAVVKHGAPMVVFDYLEGGGTDPTIIGEILGAGMPQDDFRKLHAALNTSGLITVKYFKRELPVNFSAQTRCPVRPIDYVVDDYLSENRVQTEAEYMARPVDILMIWGSSSGSRPLLAGELLKQLDRFHAYPCFALQLGDLEYNLKTNFCPIAILYQNGFWNRLPMQRVMEIQRLAKVSISCRGAGIKCFRSAEAGYNAIMAQQSVDQVQWAFPWVPAPQGLPSHKTALPNCINLPSKPGSDDIDEFTSVNELYRWTMVERGWLYPIYKLGVENNQNYVAANYVVRYLIPEICASL